MGAHRAAESPWLRAAPSKAWVQVPVSKPKPPDLPQMGGSQGLRGPGIMSPCPNVTASASALGSRGGANEEPGTPRRRPRLGLAPRILTRSPVTGWQDIGKPTSTYFNTVSHITACFPHPAALGKGHCHVSAHPTAWPREGQSSLRLELRPRLPSPPAHPQDLQDRGGATSKVQSHAHSLLPTPLGQAAGQ